MSGGSAESRKVAQPQLYIKPGESHIDIKQKGRDVAIAGVEWEQNVGCEKPIPHVSITTAVELDVDDQKLLCGVFSLVSPFYISDRHVIIEPRADGAAAADQDHFSDQGSAIVLDAPFERDRGHNIRELVARHESGHAVYADLAYSGDPDMQQKIDEAYQHLSDVSGSKNSAPWAAITEHTYYKKYWNIINNYGHPKDDATEGFASFSVAASLFPEDLIQQLNHLPHEKRQALARFGLACFDGYITVGKGTPYEHRAFETDKEMTSLFPEYSKLRTALTTAAA